MAAVGDVVWVGTEDAMDVVTALSGTGPAYFFFLAEMMIQAAMDMGLEKDAAQQLAISTLYGAGRMVRESDGNVVRLRAEVTSAGGTTEAAMRVLEAEQVRKTMARAIEAAAQRSRELAAQFGSATSRRQRYERAFLHRREAACRWRWACSSCGCCCSWRAPISATRSRRRSFASRIH